ncbi:hypothetical protein M6B38_316630 [Iris pallida]|uniref:Uncharacterized protein n=1 Tax=Iris pallida TaxID=29817 RepID=A0AAX6DMA5_IRIPA|nr:hypothetical protein M6B38_237775 [Iris pallida]KAJ6818707.1 hypothetical protein M6B38_132220 [Iris pallida]KAJ6839125.1 hypothetical protein M6B38_316630 [Iris pallida]
MILEVCVQVKDSVIIVALLTSMTRIRGPLFWTDAYNYQIVP